jgi:hypothetical protein
VVTTIGLWLEVAGCPTTCMHCWAQGRLYPTMPLADVAWVLTEVRRSCGERGLGFASFPMHEVAAHPDAAAVLRLYQEHVGAGEFEPLTTTGVPLATRDDWRDVLAAAAAVGTTTVWIAFHGAGDEHDRRVNRPGAFAESCLAVERVHAAGLRAGCNVFLTKSNLPRLDELAEALQKVGLDEISWEIAGYYPSARARRYEAIRPEVDDLVPHVAAIKELSPPYWRRWWEDLEASTEAAYVRRAAAGEWPAWPHPGGESLGLICRPNLDVHTGMPGVYRERHGNLRADGVTPVLGLALARGPCSDDALWFGSEPALAVAELAARHGDASSRRVHFRPQSVRYLWLDRAQRAAQSTPRG